MGIMSKVMDEIVGFLTTKQDPHLQKVIRGAWRLMRLIHPVNPIGAAMFISFWDLTEGAFSEYQIRAQEILLLKGVTQGLIITHIELTLRLSHLHKQSFNGSNLTASITLAVLSR
jgi:hypothetical protein